MIKRHIGFIFAFCLFLFVGVFPAQASVFDGIRYDLKSVDLSFGEDQVVVAPFVFQAFAVDAVDGIHVKYRSEGEWIDQSDLNDEEGRGEGSELIFVPSSDALLFHSDQDRVVSVTFINLKKEVYTVASLDPLLLDPSLSYLSDLSSGFRVIPRRGWGADESLRTFTPNLDKKDDTSSATPNACATLERAYPGQYVIQDKVVYSDSSGRDLIWPQRYSRKVKKIVIHHTAQSLRDLNEDGILDVRDYRLAVRAIYVYHTVSKGWGDIGYNYLVDPDGNVYEGRSGGFDVIGAHVLCQNSNTIGIAVMGNYEKNRLSSGAFEGLINITKHVSDLYKINPLGKSLFRGKVLPNIVTHAEVGEVTKSFIGRGATACPGVFLKKEMSRLRKIVSDGGLKPDLAFEVLDSPKNVQVSPLHDMKAIYSLKNTGKQRWTKIIVSRGRKEVFSDDSVLVDPGKQYDLRLLLQSGLDGGRKRLSFSVYINSQRMSQRLSFNFLVQRPKYRYDLIAINGVERSLLIGEKRSVSITLKNISNFPWLADGPYQVQIQEFSRKNNKFFSKPRALTLFLSERVDPDNEIRLSFDLPVQRKKGFYQLELMPVLGRDRGFRGKRISIRLPVDRPRFSVDIKPVDRRLRIIRGFEKQISLKVINTSNFDWDENMVLLKFHSGVEKKSDQKILIDKLVPIGGSFEFRSFVRAEYVGRIHPISGIVFIDKSPAFLKKSVLRKRRVSFDLAIPMNGRVRLLAEKKSQSVEFLSNEEQETQVWVDLKNIGSVPWYRDGVDRMVLSVADSADFVHKTWKHRSIAGFLKQDRIMPGEIGRFLLTLNVRKPVIRSISDTFVPTIYGQDNLKIRVKGGKIHFGIKGSRTKKKRTRKIRDVRTNTRKSSFKFENKDNVLPSVRVLLTGIDRDEVSITADGSFHTWVSDTQKTKKYNGGEDIVVKSDQLKDGTIIRMKADGVPYLRFLNWDRIQPFGKNLNDNTFRNVLEFRWDAEKGKMIVINELSLEDYMKGIAEVPESVDQPEEKRKVIAVLSRSYALHYLISGYEKFPGKPYNASDSPAVFQKYLGYGFEQRAPKWLKAVQDTKGEVVLFQWPSSKTPSPKGGQVIRTAYFSCTDGDRTKSWNEVWPDNEYFQKFGSVFQSVEDPWGDDPTREGNIACGHQVGLSGYGATQMAKEGWNYRDIIQYYYHGVEVGELGVDG